MCSGWPSGLAHCLQPWDDWEEEFERWCYEGASGTFNVHSLDWEIAADDFEDDNEHDTYQAESPKRGGTGIKIVGLKQSDGQTDDSHKIRDRLFDISTLVVSPKQSYPAHHSFDDASPPQLRQPKASAKLQPPVVSSTTTAHINVEPTAGKQMSNLEPPKEIRSGSESNMMNPISSIMYLAHQLETTRFAGKHKTQELTESNLMDSNELLTMRSRADHFNSIFEATNALEALNVHLMAVLTVTKLKKTMGLIEH